MRLSSRLALVLSLVYPVAVWAQPAANVPAPRMDENSRLAHQQLIEKAKKGKIDVYFVGDSITRRWGATDYPEFLAHWTETFHGWNAANMAWGGDSTQNILWRLHNGELEGVQPKVFVVLAGTNNLSARRGEDQAADVAQGVWAVVNACREKAPQAKVVLMGIFPRNDNLAYLPVIKEINSRLEKQAAESGGAVRFLNINDKLANAEGTLNEGVSPDRLHLSLPGYRIWGESLKPVLTDLLGPRAAEDQAPPPTGDPSAKPRS